MAEQESNIVKKLGWTNIEMDVPSSDESLINHCKSLEIEGFGMLADKINPDQFDKTSSVVFPSGEVLTIEQINDYWEQKNSRSGSIYSTSNSRDVDMHKAQVYYHGFKHGTLKFK